MKVKQDSEITIEYMDTDGDKIAILDDDDLQLAYESALEETNGNLKLHISEKKNEPKEAKAVEPKEDVDQIKDGIAQMQIDDPQDKVQNFKGDPQDEDDEKLSSSSSDSEDEKHKETKGPHKKHIKKNKFGEDGKPGKLSRE